MERLFKRKTWTDEEKSAVELHFKAFIEGKKLPGKLDIEAVIDQEPVLQQRTWQNIKDFCRNALLGVHVLCVFVTVCVCVPMCIASTEIIFSWLTVTEQCPCEISISTPTVCC